MDRFYKMYQRFCETHHAPMMSKSWLGRNLKDIVPEIVGDKRRIGGSSVRVWSNIRIEGTSFESESDEDSGNGGDEAGSGLASADDADTADDATDKSQSGEEEGGESQPDSENSDSGKSLNSVDSGTGKNSPIAHAGARNEYIEKQFRQMPGPLSQNKDDQEVIKTFDSVTTDTLREAISDVTSETGRDFAAVDELEPYFTLSADELENNLQKLKRDGDVYKPRGAGYAVV